MLYPDELRARIGRGREIRTPDILLPKQARYQTALYPETRPEDSAQMIVIIEVNVNIKITFFLIYSFFLT